MVRKMVIRVSREKKVRQRGPEKGPKMERAKRDLKMAVIAERARGTRTVKVSQKAREKRS